MIGEEKQFFNRGKQAQKEKKVIQEQKRINKERVQKGLDPIYLKKSKILGMNDVGEIKELQHKEKFEQLEKKGQLDKFIEKK